MRVFVYGTLKRGGSNHRLLANSTFVGTYKTPPKYAMYSLGAYPAVTLENKRIAVSGEIWQVDKNTLENLDWLEGVPDLYDRITMRCGKYGQCHVYVMIERPSTGVLILSGEWK